MKNIVLLLVFTGLIICSKAQYQEKYYPTVQEFKLAMDEIVQKNMGKSSTGILDIKDEEILTVFYTYCKAIESNPEEIKIYKKSIHQKLALSHKNKTNPNEGWNPITILGYITGWIEDRFSYNFRRILTTPYFLKIKIVSKEAKTLSTLDGIPTDQVHLYGIIEEVVKCGRKFRQGDKIFFKYIDRQPENKDKYKIGETYFIPFRVITKETSAFEGLFVQFYSIGDDVYLVKDDKIFIPDNFFLLGEKIDWEIFKNEFTDKYLSWNLQ